MKIKELLESSVSYSKTTTTTTFYIAGFTVATGAKFYIFSPDGKAGQDAKPHLFVDRAEALKLAEQAASAYPLHAVAFVLKLPRRHHLRECYKIKD